MLTAHKMRRNKEFADRLRKAWLLYQLQRDGESYTQEWLATAVGEKLGRTVNQSAISRWFKGALPEGLDAMAALAHVLEVPAGWLYFSEGPEPIPPPAD